MLCRVWEVQQRGVLHVHPVMAYATARERAAVTTYREALERLASQYGFGFVSQKFRSQPACAAAAYLSAYFCEGKKSKLALHESVLSSAMPRSIVHVSNVLTQATGITMRELRFRRFVWARFPWMVSSGDPHLIAVAREWAELEREIRRELSSVERRCLWACERASLGP